MTRSIQRLTLALLLGYAALALATGLWNTLLAPQLLARQDNPRPIETLRRIQRGEILDRNGTVLAQSLPGSDAGTWQRVYPHPQAAPVVGYSSFKHGASGVEAAYDNVLLGLEGRDPSTAAWDDALHRLPAGRSVRLTIDLNLQIAADEALGRYRGAVIVLDAGSGELLALASHPGYDPNTLDAYFDILSQDPAAPLINRTTQGSYQPGPALEPALLAAALDRGIIQPGTVVTGAGAPLDLGLPLSCAGDAGADVDARQALAYACPGFFAHLGSSLGAAALDDTFVALGFYAAPRLPLPIAVPEHLAPGSEVRDLALAATGQGELTVTPLHVALVTAALARGGVQPAPRLVQSVQAAGGGWADVVTAPGRQVLAPLAAQQVRDWLLAAPRTLGPASAAASGTLPVAGHAGVALSGGKHDVPEGLSWFSGYAIAPGSGDPLVVTVLVERSTDARAAAFAARSVFAALAASAVR